MIGKNQLQNGTAASRSVLKQIVLLGFSIGMIVVLGMLVRWEEVWSAVRQARPLPLFCAFALTLLFPLLNMLRWQSVLLALGIRMRTWRVFQITMACWPVGTLTPGKAGELLKAAAVSDRTLGIGSVLAERIIDVAVLGAFGVFFGVLAGSLWAVLGGAFGIVAALGVVAGARFARRILSGRKIAAKLDGFLIVAPRLAAQPRLLTACVLASGLNWFLSMLQLWLLLEAFGAPAPLVLIVAILPAATFAGLLPITIAGAGTRDAALLLLAGSTIDPGALLASSIVYTLFGYFFLGVAGLPFLAHLMQHGFSKKAAAHEGARDGKTGNAATR